MTKDDLIMAHDNLQRELADYKRLNQKDKHELIKSNISKIRKIEELEKEVLSHKEFIWKLKHEKFESVIKKKDGLEILNSIADIVAEFENLEGEE